MDFSDFILQLFIRIFSVKSLLPIHICCFWKTNYCENVFQVELSSETVDDSRRFFRRVSSSKRSLLNSFKYAFSILSLSSSSSSSLTCSALVSTGFSPSYLEGFLHSLISNVFLRPFFLVMKDYFVRGKIRITLFNLNFLW